ncbi:MAG TPA: hypothetical protein VNL37_03400 [Candidatus Polarisedimenticolia bacterium]|nr:hypothetical protein [Candidatus Polarisedimenticolia bacterium]
MRRILVPLMIAALAWEGVLLTLPHDHEQAGVTRYAADCALSGTASPHHHLHRLPEPLPPHHCLACLAGHVLPLSRGRVTSLVPTPAARVAMAAETLVAARTVAVLPGRRGPPTSA